ncbi:hypothetical protein [Kutzneria buriramensis]|uniref:Uncharacterized protein n=1 Tax=Kutzneria buriramensis TaxID=1045776 RepID=A0A3E0GWT9_9PSEU|nr:hypothetical protein [Kutzneria buriramensis]REH31135.1 hypothetical protein BCF44_122158 [Kutzneria buriramensis]
MTPDAPSGATCREHQFLLEEIARCHRDLAQFPGEDPDHQRAREILAELAEHCRAAATVFVVDPTLADEPHGTHRFRTIDLLAELTRQSRGLLRGACSTVALDRWPRQARWDELEALLARTAEIAAVVPQAIPRLDYATEAGSRRISRDRLAAHARQLATAADEIRDAVAAALRLSHPDPQALELAGLADQLKRYGDDLAVHHTERTDALAAACRPSRLDDGGTPQGLAAVAKDG